MPELRMPDDFSVRVSDGGDAITIRCEGELDIAVTSMVRDAVLAVLRGTPNEIALDWTGVTFMDSSGIRLLLQTMLLCRDHGVELTWSLSDAARKTLDLVGIHDALLTDHASGSGGAQED